MTHRLSADVCILTPLSEIPGEFCKLSTIPLPLNVFSSFHLYCSDILVFSPVCWYFLSGFFVLVVAEETSRAVSGQFG